MARLEALAAAALSRELAAREIHRLPPRLKVMMAGTVRQLVVGKVVLVAAAHPMLDQIMAVVKVVLVVMVQRGLMVFPTLVVVVVVMVTLALGAAVLVVLAGAALAMVTGLQHQQRRALQTEAVAVAVRGHLAMALVAAQVLLFSVTLIPSLLQHLLRAPQQLQQQVDFAITHLPDQVQSLFKL